MRNLKRTIAITVYFSIIPAVALGNIINIPDDYPTIQQGIDASTNGDSVLVQPGTYVETIVIENKNVLLTSAEGPETTRTKGFLFFEAGLDTTCIFRGFTVIPDSSSEWYERRALINVNEGSPIIEGNKIRFGINTTLFGGGVSTMPNSGPVIRGNIISDNMAPNGGGISASAGVIIERNILSNNIAVATHGAFGGGISMSAGVARFNLIIDNQSISGDQYIEGGGIYSRRSSLPTRHIYNNTIVGNSARMGQYDARGGGIYFDASSDQNDDVFFKNNIMAFNTHGGGVFAHLVDSVEIAWDYNLVFGNHSANYIGIEPGIHDVQQDPLFVDRFSGDYHLLPNSPCIDAGDPDFPLDPDSTRADIGAYYFDQTVGIDDPEEPTGPYNFRLQQNYPNPFNAQTIISYNLSEESVVSLMVFSIKGQLVSSIVDREIQLAGDYQYVWDGVDMSGQSASTGIYFYELYVDDHRESKAMILIK